MDFIYRRQETSFFLVHLSKLAANCLMGPVKFLALAALTTQIFRLPSQRLKCAFGLILRQISSIRTVAPTPRHNAWKIEHVIDAQLCAVCRMPHGMCCMLYVPSYMCRVCLRVPRSTVYSLGTFSNGDPGAMCPQYMQH